jgi:putative ABC transport system ATP-binding protein
MSTSDRLAPPLQMQNVTKRFRQGDTTIEALKDVSLCIERGQFVAVMGASGSGKSTLLHVMAGLTLPDEGRVMLEGRNLSTMSDYERTLLRRRRVGMIFQAFNLVQSLSAEQNVLLPLLADRRYDQSRDRLDALLLRLSLVDRRHHLPDAMSGGEQQRVAIARALVTGPALILADEPTGSLDSVSGQTLCRLLRDLSVEEGRAIVMVTHEPTVARWAQRIVVLRDGRLISEFPTSAFSDAHSLAAHYQDIVSGEAVAEVST